MGITEQCYKKIIQFNDSEKHIRINIANRIGLDGKSGYEVAKENGFKGTEEEYGNYPVTQGNYATDAAKSALTTVAGLIEEVLTAIQSSNEATQGATDAAVLAAETASGIEQAISNTSIAAKKAESAAETAAEVTRTAEEAGVDAATKADLAQTAAANANSKALTAQQASELALAQAALASTAADHATSGAETAAAAANHATEVAENLDGRIRETEERLENKADLVGGTIPSQQIAPFLGRQTGTNTSGVYFSATAPGLLFGGDRSIEVFFTTGEDITSNQSVVTNNSHIAPRGTRITIANRALSAAYKREDYIVAQPNYLQPNTYYHVVLTPFKLYINGVWAGNIISGGSNEPIDYSLGSYPYTTAYPFKGMIHSSRLFNYALSQEEALKLWNGGRPEKFMLPSAGTLRTGLAAEYLPFGLLPDMWRDTSGNGLDLAVSGTPKISYQTVPDLTEITVDTGVFYTNIAEGTASKSIAIPEGYRVGALTVSNLNQGSLTKVAASLNGAGIFTGQTITAASPSLIYSVSGLAYKKTGNTLSVNATGNTTDGGIQVKVVCKWTGL